MEFVPLEVSVPLTGVVSVLFEEVVSVLFEGVVSVPFDGGMSVLFDGVVSVLFERGVVVLLDEVLFVPSVGIVVLEGVPSVLLEDEVPLPGFNVFPVGGVVPPPLPLPGTGETGEVGGKPLNGLPLSVPSPDVSGSPV